ncbi:MAG: ActS/PrrB/RegB family redox-sensitive histidine kinase [Gemmobacter sp.]|nr:ActS/PrrB/RegB family redox-sensitive histidine kinase [Gemmobacter sp.]
MNFIENHGPARSDASSNWVRLRTLTLLRWIAIGGQAAAILLADLWLDLVLPLGGCLLVIGLSVIANLVSIVMFPQTRRLPERHALVMLAFDLAQLSALLMLTGGLHNPFALLIVVPVTIAATALSARSTAVLGTLTLVSVTVFAFFHLPLSQGNGDVLQVPPVFEFGFWLSITIGVVFLAVYAQRVSAEIRNMAEALLATQMALAREQKLTDLGGVVAAAAHELGTPLATIKLVSAELIDELDGKPGLEDLRDDAALIRDQADRCRDILRSMGRAGKDDLHLRHALLEAVLHEAAEPHSGRGKTLVFDVSPGEGGEQRQPTIRRAPEVIHGLRNLVQNAVDFAEGSVWIDGHWTDTTVSVRIIDDGPGYPPQLLGRIGDPFLRARTDGAGPRERPGYEGMGLGLFIAKTLLERSGAELSFANGGDPFLKQSERSLRSGAIVEVIWPKHRICVEPDAILGGNTPFLA